MEKKTRNKRQSSVKKQPPSSVSATVVQKPKVHSVLNMPLNSETARQAVILSEVIGKPVSKRGRRR